MSEQEHQDGQKTVVAFIAGLLIGGLLMWVFAGNDASAPTDAADATSADDDSAMMHDTDTSSTGDVSSESMDDVAPAVAMNRGDGALVVSDQSAGTVVKLDSVTFPMDEGWIGVRDYVDGDVTGLLGVARFSNEQGLIPEEVELLRATVPGNQYAVIFYTESGDREFDLADDIPYGNTIATFTAK